MVEEIVIFADLLAAVSLDAFHLRREPESAIFERLRQLQILGNSGDNQALLQAILPFGQPELIRVFAASSLDEKAVTSEQIEKLAEWLMRDDSRPLQIAVARKLRRVPLGETLPPLSRALVLTRDPELRTILAYSIRDTQAVVTWRERVVHLLAALKDSGLFREQLDMAIIITAMFPEDDNLPVSNRRDLLTEHLIEKVLTFQNDQQMIGILAGLVIECAGRSVSDANKIVEIYRKNHGLPKLRVKHLLAAMNNYLTLSEVETNLRESFQIPLNQNLTNIQDMWVKSSQEILDGLTYRRWLSSFIIVVGGATILLGLVFLFVDRSVALILFGLGLSLIGLAAVYAGPVRETSKRLAEIGVANAAFTAYVQRTLTIGSGVGRQYLEGRLSLDDIERANKLVGMALKDAVDAFREEGAGSIEELINKLG
jgi:hypothetical protein